jgi:hypothetical protein
MPGGFSSRAVPSPGRLLRYLDAQRGQRPGRVAADGAWRAAKHLRDLGIGEPFVVAEYQHGALPPGQLPELG